MRWVGSGLVRSENIALGWVIKKVGWVGLGPASLTHIHIVLRRTCAAESITVKSCSATTVEAARCIAAVRENTAASVGNLALIDICKQSQRAFKYGYVKTVFNVEQLLQNYNDNLLTKATYENHAMHHLLPSFKYTCYNLRSHGHGLTVSLVKSELHKNILSTEFYLVSVIRFLWLLSY